MAVTLRDLLSLPVAEELVERPDQSEDFKRQFIEGIERINENLRVAAAQASPSEFQGVDGQRLKLYEAYHKALSQVDPADPKKADQAISRVLDAVTAVETKAAALSNGAQQGQKQWLERQPVFDDVMLQIGELEVAGHPKAADFRKLGEAIRDRANGRSFTEAAGVLEKLQPKLAQVTAQVEPAPVGQLGRDGEAPPLEGDVDEDELLKQIIEIVAQQAGIDVSELGDIKDLPAEVLQTAREILKQINPAAAIADQIAKLGGDFLKQLIDALRKIIEKRRVKLACLVSVENNSDETLTLKNAKFVAKRGNFSPGQVPKNTLGPGETDVFQAESPRHANVFGVVANMDYVVNDKKELEWSIHFSNPRDRQIKAKSSLSGKREDEFKTPQPQPTTGDTATFAFQLNLANDPNPPEPVHPEVPDGPDPKEPTGGGTPPPAADLQASCLITVNNNSASALTLIDQGHELGDFMTSPPPTLAAGGSAEFVVVETPGSDDSGVQGFAEWEIEGGKGTWRIDWNNPEGEKNESDSTFGGEAEKSFRGLDQMGQGDENVPVTYTLSDSGDPSGTPPVKPGEDAPREGLTIVVKDGSTGDVIEGAAATIGDQSDTTSSLGLATVELPVGKHKYEVSKEGFGSKSDEHEIIKGDNPELIVELTPGGGAREGLTIVVRDADSGEVIEGANVTIGDQSDTTSNLGLATVELPVGKHSYEVEAKEKGYESKSGEHEIIKGDNPELIVELNKDGECEHATLAVIVVDDESTIVLPDATVTVGPKTEQSSAAGLAVFTLEPGDHNYEVSHPDYPASETGTVTVEEGDDNELEVRMKKESTTTTVTFHITDVETSEALPDVDISLTDSAGKKSGKTDKAGQAVIEIEPGKIPFSATKAGYQDGFDSFEAPAGENTDVHYGLAKEPPFNPPPETPQPTLRKGDEGEDGWVEYLQQLLNERLGAGTVQVNGTFDQATYDAVKKFQDSTEPKCLVDGIVGNETWSMLREQTPREAVGVRQKGEHEEKGAEARWLAEGDEGMTYDATADEFQMTAYSVGDEAVDEFLATVQITGQNGRKKVTTHKLGAPEGTPPTGDGQRHVVRIPEIRTRFGEGSHDIHAYLDEKLGGDSWIGKIEVPAGSGVLGDGSGGDAPTVDGATVDGATSGEATGGAAAGDAAAGGGATGGEVEVDPEEDFQQNMAHVEVTVLDDQGKPVTGALIRVTGKSGQVRLGHTESKGVGVVSMSAQIEEEQTVSAALGKKKWWSQTIPGGGLRLGKTYKVTLDKTSEADLGGLDVRVVRKGTNDGVKGVVLQFSPFVVPTEFSDDKGNAKFKDVPVGKYKVGALDLQSQAADPTTVYADVEIVKDKTNSVTIELP